MSEYDQQFQADLEKAQALSLESLALDQFRRQKFLNGSGSEGSRREASSSGRDAPPALPPPPRISRPRTSLTEQTRSGGTSPAREESSDLISFSSPISKAPPKDPHESLKEYINKLGQQTEDLTLATTKDQSPITMNNHFYNQQRPPYYPPTPQYNYGFPPPYTHVPAASSYPPSQSPYPAQSPYPPTPYGMPSPMPNFTYYQPMAQHEPPPYIASPAYVANIPYSQTRMSTPAPYMPFPAAVPQHNNTYNYSTTNMISRPTRPLYPPLPQPHSYPPPPGNSVMSPEPRVELREDREPLETRPSRKTSEVSVASNESNDTIGSLPASLNLIDFGKGRGAAQGSVRVSVLEAFDPLLTDQRTAEYAVPSECSSSVYEEYDPLDFLYGETEMRDAPLYASVNKRESAALPSPPPKSLPGVPAVISSSTTNKLYDSIVKLTTRNYDSEHKAFLQMVLDVRKKFVHSDVATNPGHVVAARGAGRYPRDTSVKLLVHTQHHNEPICFTSDVEATVDHVILTVVCSLDEEIREDMSGYMLRVHGASEYLAPSTLLSEYDYVRECVRLEKDVRLCLHEGKDKSLARTELDDSRAARLTMDDLLPSEGAPTLTFDSLNILFETLEGELSRAAGVAGAEGTCPPTAVFQAVKAICALAGGVETLHVTRALQAFAQACTAQGPNNVVTPEIISDGGAYSSVSVRRANARESVTAQACRVRDAVRSLVALYARAHLVDLRLADSHHYPPDDPSKAVSSHTVSESTLFCVEGVHGLPPGWQHDEYSLHAQLYHGTRPLPTPRATPPTLKDQGGFYPRIIFDTWLNIDEVEVRSLPREARLVLTLVGRTQRTAAPDDKSRDDRPRDDRTRDDKPTDNDKHDPTQDVYQEELGWAAIQLFDYDGMLASGNYMLPLWPPCTDKRIGPAPRAMTQPPQPHANINIEIPLYAHTGVKWSSGAQGKELSKQDLPSFDSLDGHTQSQLLHLIEQGTYQKMPTEGREVMWEKRQYLVELAGALPLILLAASCWTGDQRDHLLALLRLWEPPEPRNAMHLLLPCFPDAAVREYATSLVAQMSDDGLCLALPQLVQAVRVESWDASPLAALLLARALAAPRVAHALFWLLVHSLPHVPHSTSESLGISFDDSASEGAGAHGGEGCCAAQARAALLLRALLAAGGERLAAALRRQHDLVKSMCAVAQGVKAAKEGVRGRALTAGAQQLAGFVRAQPVALPLGLPRLVSDVDVKSCMFFASNTLPLKINFMGLDNAVIPAMFKVGDDLRQDALVLQLMRVMDALWLQAGLDLRMVLFQALPTNYRRGMIEIVSEAETLRAIQTEWGLTGSFKDKPIAEWLAKHNPSELEYQRARDNFTASCAGYSVTTYLLGICDRHNDNIMLKTSGHLFHIDFGKFLGDAQMFGNFKRDRAPFVLTHDMVYVINGGERPTQRFHHFVELCCMAFNVVRAHRGHILDLVALMATSGVPGVTSAAVGYVRAALLPAAGNAEAAAAFARLIHSSLKSKFTPINFFLHNLAQFRASGDQGVGTSELLSFMPRTYTMASEGRLESVQCLGYEKRYDPEKHYVYALRVHRAQHATPSTLYRSYKHFTELYQKICLHFPLAKVHSLPSGLHVGRSNIRQVAERRLGDVQAFLESLFSLADEIAHSDLVYTFFHPLLRDQQDVEPQRQRNGGAVAETGGGSGSLKLSVQYAGGALSVLVLHAQSLALTPQGLPPNPYVKVYLVPDPTKETKRKTRVLKRNSHPSFMDMLEYRLPLEAVVGRSLQATVWHYDSLQENQFLGGVVIPLHALDLRQETVAWYPLEYIPR